MWIYKCLYAGMNVCNFCDDDHNCTDENGGCKFMGEATEKPTPSGQTESALLVVQVKNLFKELDDKHHLAETEYLRTKSKFDHGRAAALGEACSKLMLILNEYP